MFTPPPSATNLTRQNGGTPLDAAVRWHVGSVTLMPPNVCLLSAARTTSEVDPCHNEAKGLGDSHPCTFRVPKDGPSGLYVVGDKIPDGR